MNRRVIRRSTQLESFSPWILQMGWSNEYFGRDRPRARQSRTLRRFPQTLPGGGSGGGLPGHSRPGRSVLENPDPALAKPPVRVGIRSIAKLALLVYIGARFIRPPLPPPQLRRFPWLQAIEGLP
jgi:hypothetical protein